MAPLYKRYVPPKPPTVPAPEPQSILKKPPPLPTPTINEEPKKRKRERSEEGVAERKAKKLRKKGIDPNTVDFTPQKPQAGGRPTDRSEERQRENKTEGEDSNVVHNEAQGEFAHIRNAKKRHKLEKEARKARKAASKQEDVNLQNNAHEAQNGDPEAGEAVANAGQDVEESTTPREESSPAIVHAKKRRHKLESTLKSPKEPTHNGNADDAEEPLRKHKSIQSKYQRSLELAKDAPQPTVASEQPKIPEPVLRDLAPLPQPEKAPTPEFRPDAASLPPWLATPILVSADFKLLFSNLSIEPKTVEHLSKLGFHDALPVQSALIPLLLPPGTPGSKFLPGTESILPDVAVSAPTGSGKTIAYLLPMIEALRTTAGQGNLQGLVVVPTRELVLQVAAVAESLARGSSVRIGVSTGGGSFKAEQTKLVNVGRRYDPERYTEFMGRAHRRNNPPSQDSDDFEPYLDEIEEEDVKQDQLLRDAVACLSNHVPEYRSAVDILVVTPGRLLEHLSATLGFSLSHLSWLVLDEADKLLDQQYDGFLQTINNEVTCPREMKDQDARERYLRAKGVWNEQRERRVRKVVLSATMTRDISKLIELNLKRPQMIVVRGAEQTPSSMAERGDKVETESDLKESFELPPTIEEYSVPVGDGSEKPLYLVELLRTRIIEARDSILYDQRNGLEDRTELNDREDTSTSDSESSASSHSDSDSVPESDSDSDTDSSASSEPNSDNAPQHPSPAPKDDSDLHVHPSRINMLANTTTHNPHPAPTILIFTSSTESANRLSHLLQTLTPAWAPHINAMTRSDPKRKPNSSLAHTTPRDPLITVSTDRAARGLDALGANRAITHVIQYDVPRSATSYVHRVGRTARVGRRGQAWTLYSHAEARWFMSEVVRSRRIRRRGGVEKVKVGAGDEEARERFAKAIAGIRNEVYGRGSRR